MNSIQITIRHAKLSDLTTLQSLFTDTIITINKKDYSPEQIKAWTTSVEHTERWVRKLKTQYFIIAELENKTVGFVSLESNGHVDLLYVHKDYQRQGIASRLYAAIEAEAIKQGQLILTSDVSITARPFFEKKGYSIVRSQKIKIREIEIMNFKMVKHLGI